MTSNIKQYISCRPTFPCVTLFLCVAILSFNCWVMSENYNEVLKELQEAKEQEQVAHQKRASSEKITKFMENDLFQLRKDCDKMRKTLDENNKELAKLKKEAEDLNNKVMEKESEVNKISTDKQAREADLEKCHNNTKDKDERSNELEAEISSLKKNNFQLQKEFELLKNKVPGNAVLETKIFEEVQQKETDQAKENTQLQSEKVKTKTKKGLASVKKNKLPSKRKLLSFGSSKLLENHDDQYQDFLKQDSSNEEQRIYKQIKKKPSSSFYKYKWPLQMTASNDPRNENMENIQRIEFWKNRNVSPYKTKVQVPLSSKEFSGNRLDSRKFPQSETVNSLTQQGLIPQTQGFKEDSQQTPNNFFNSDSYRFTEQKSDDPIYWQFSKPKFAESYNWFQERNNNIESRRNSETRPISNTYNRIIPSEKNKALDTSYGPLVGNENAQHPNDNADYGQDNGERYIWHKPVYFETKDSSKTDFKWNQADSLQDAKLPFQPRSKSSLPDDAINYQSNSDVYKETDQKSSLQYGEDRENEYNKQIQANREWELALLKRISNLLEKVRNNLDNINSYNNESPMESLAQRDKVQDEVPLYNINSYNNESPMESLAQRDKVQDEVPLYNINSYNNESPMESLAQRDKVQYQVPLYGNEDGVKNIWEASSDNDQSKSLEQMQNSSLEKKIDIKPKTPSWLDFLQKSLLSEEEKNRNSKKTSSNEVFQDTLISSSNTDLRPTFELQNGESREASETSDNLGTEGQYWRLHNIFEIFKNSDENGSENGQLKDSQDFGSFWNSSETRKVGLDESVDNRENEEGNQRSSIYLWESPIETYRNNEQKVDDQSKLHEETNYEQNLVGQQTSNQDVNYVPNWQVQWKIKDENADDENERNLSNGIISTMDKQWHEERTNNDSDQNATVTVSSYAVNENIQENKTFDNNFNTILTDKANEYNNERDFQNNVQVEDLMEKFNLPSEEETRKESQDENNMII
ncbi:homeobox protein 2-like isoform X2 [Limulus polyphemus]|uniref:Homeobox protein 2-like isoform X2 n=1 Tax=Limulus polyphemus TaxID=6850 RepID=A0ABM1SAP5_LIMPO|nr:homeobox protein 2-like isoform X2 [Limulus polyphemus]